MAVKRSDGRTGGAGGARVSSSRGVAMGAPFRRARGGTRGREIVVFLDGDGSDPAEVPAACRTHPRGEGRFRRGSRIRGSATPEASSPQQIEPGRGRLLLRAVYGARFSDLSPFRAIRRDTLRQLGMRDTTYGWNLEMLMRVAAARLPALEIPVGQRRRIGGVSKVSGNLVAGVKAAAVLAITFVRFAVSLRRERRQ